MTRWRFHALASFTAAIAFMPGKAAAQDCLAYLAADKAFHEQMVASSPIFQAVRDAIESKNETELLALESQEKGRWKAFVECWKKLELEAAQSAEAMAASDEVLAALKIHNAIPLSLLSGAARD